MQFWKRSSSTPPPPPPPPQLTPLPPIPSKTDPFLPVAASMAASAILFRSVLLDLVPDVVQEYFSTNLKKLSNCLSSQLTVVIEDSDGLTKNQMFQAASVYLGSKLSPTTRRIKVNKPEKENQLAVTIDTNQEMVDLFKGVKIRWVLLSSPIKQSAVSKNKRNESAFLRNESRHFELTCYKKYRDMVLRCYLPYILRRAKEISEEKKTLKLHTVDYNGTDFWGSVNFDHPANFNTIAMDVGEKQSLIEDLNRFVSGKEYYRRVGRAWKRGYLFYGPPGTGKSSLVAAIANHLKFDLFDLDLKEVQCDSDLRRLLIGTKNRSILVIEDIDRTLKQVEEEKVTLAGLLNFIDGLWSSCGDERIIVFTTNNKDQLDPALLRPGRMDVHIEMSYCTFVGFKILANNYLKIQDHPLFGEIEELFGKVKATPAEIAGELMKSQDPDVALQGLIVFLQNKQANISAQ